MTEDLPTTDESSNSITTESGVNIDFNVLETQRDEVEDFHVAPDDHPLVIESGGNINALKSSAELEGMRKIVEEDIYEGGVKAFFREYPANAETACIRAAKEELRKHDADKYSDDWFTVSAGFADGRHVTVPRPPQQIFEEARKVCGYKPVIEITWNKDDRKYTISDNGIGFLSAEFIHVFNKLSRSGVQGDQDTSGMFGIGSASVQMALQGARFMLQTRSRRRDAPEHDKDGWTAYGKPGDYKPVPGTPDEGWYGSHFEIPVSEDVNVNVREWTAKYCRKLRVPVVYEEFSGGQSVYDEEWGGRNWKNIPGVQRVVDKPGEYLILLGDFTDDERGMYLQSMPIGSWSRSGPLDTKMDSIVHIMNEHGRIVAGPNRGKLVDEVDMLEDGDVPLAQPTANRDRFKSNGQKKKMMDHLNTIAKEEEKSIITDITDSVDTAQELVQALRERADIMAMRDLYSQYAGYNCYEDYSKIRSNMKRYFGVEDRDMQDVFARLFMSTDYAIRDTQAVSNRKHRRSISPAQKLQENKDVQFYVACSINEQRCKVLWNTDENAEVFRVKNTKQYDVWQDLLGAKLLKDVPQRGEHDDWDVPEHLVDAEPETNTTKDTPTGERTLQYGHGTSQSRTSKTTLDEWLNNHDDTKTLFIFDTETDRNLSNHRQLTYAGAIANTTKGEAEYLLEHGDNTVRIDDAIDAGADTWVSPYGRNACKMKTLVDEYTTVVLLAYNGDKPSTWHAWSALYDVMDTSYHSVPDGSMVMVPVATDELEVFVPYAHSLRNNMKVLPYQMAYVNNAFRTLSTQNDTLQKLRADCKNWPMTHTVYDVLDEGRYVQDKPRNFMMTMLRKLHDAGYSADDVESGEVDIQ